MQRLNYIPDRVVTTQELKTVVVGGRVVNNIPDRVVTTQELNLGLNKISDEGA